MTHSFGASVLLGYSRRFAGIELGERAQVGIHAVLFPGVTVGAGLSGGGAGGVGALEEDIAYAIRAVERLAAPPAELATPEWFDPPVPSTTSMGSPHYGHAIGVRSDGQWRCYSCHGQHPQPVAEPATPHEPMTGAPRGGDLTDDTREA